MKTSLLALFSIFALAIVLALGMNPAPASAATPSTTIDLHLTGDQEVPPHQTPVSVLGRLTITGLDVSYTLTVSGVDASQITAAHIHRGAVGVNGPIIYPFTSSGFIITTGKVTLTPDDMADLLRGNLYVNVHSVTNPGGDVRAQITPPRIAMLYQQQVDAYNKGDLPGVMAAFAENAVVAHPPLCIPAPCMGKAAIQQDEAVELAERSHLSVQAFGVSGNTLTVLEEVSADSIKATGVSRIRSLDNVVFAGDRIVSLSGDADFSDPQTATYIQALSAQFGSGGPPFRPPNTGDAGLLTEPPADQ